MNPATSRDNAARDTTDIVRVCPASFLQQALWVICQVLPDEPLYNEPNVFRIRGALDSRALERALNEIVRRHEVLRTVFRVRDGEPVQLITRESTIALGLTDLASVPAGEREAAAHRHARDEARARFDLEHGPLVRARLLRLEPDHHWLVLTLHHIVRDGESSVILAKELTALYRAYRAGEPSPLPDLALQYGDFAQRQREQLRGPSLDAELAYWREALAQIGTLELPTDRARPRPASHRGGVFAFELGPELTSRLKALRKAEGVTLFTLLLAAFQVLLYRYSGQEDIPVGVVVAGRAQPELNTLIGYFVNMLVVRGDLSGEPTFREHLSRVRARTRDAYAHQGVPFSKLVEALAPPRDPARSPLFQVSFGKGTQRDERPELDGLLVEDVAAGSTETAKFDLDFTVAENDGKIDVTIEYASALFDASTIERMAGHWRVLLEGIAADPEQLISRLPLLTEAERSQLARWNDTTVAAPREACVHELFETQALRTPEAVAVVEDDDELTYAELDARANRLAHHLRSLGVQQDVPVAIAMERSSELIVGLLGVLKAGGAYVPLDPGYPMERLGFMLDETRAPVLLTQERFLGKLPVYGGHTVCVDRDRAAVAAHPEGGLAPSAAAGSLAYVIYTSGSTGRPKGVMVEHRSVVNYLTWISRQFPVSRSDRALHKTPISFDASAEELFLPLVCGAALVVAAPDVQRSVERLIATIRKHRVSVLQVVPSLLGAMLDDEGFRACDSLRLILCGAEVLSPELVRRFRDQSSAELVNLYGPTETTISSTFRRCNDDVARRSVPIGAPIANTTTIVVDRGDQLVPVGVAGELCIGGAGVARGYLNLPELTAGSFVADRSSGDPAARLYRTGDLVRRLPDGALEFLGRRDEQVKVRGFRVEPGEIEAALKQHAAVRDASVATRRGKRGTAQLVAFVVASRDASLDAGELRTFLLRRLPDYMVPVAFAVLDSLPLTRHGKVDRNALSSLMPELESSSVERVGPRNAVEVQLMRIWEQVLDVSPVGMRDNFFALGGDSLGAVRVIDRIEQLFGKRLPPDMLWYQEGTIESLARALIGDGNLRLWAAPVAIKPTGKRRPLFCPHIIGGHLYFYDNLARHLHPEQPLYGLPARGIDGKEAPDSNIEAIATHCISTMKQVQAKGPYLLAGYCSGAVVAFEMARQLRAHGEGVGLLALCDSLAPGFHPLEFALTVRDFLLLRNVRRVQQRFYRFVLQNIGLGHLRRFKTLTEAHYWALLAYSPQPYAGNAILFRASHMDDSRSPSLGWKKFVTGGLEVRPIPAGHAEMVREPTVRLLAEQLEHHLARAGREAWSGETTRRLFEPGTAVGL